MEKLLEEKKNQFSKSSSARYSNSSLWDCGSTLYDSFEFNSFKRQLDSAIANSQQQPSSAKKLYKFSRRSFQKFLRSVFKSSNKSDVSSSSTSTSSGFQVGDKYSKERFYVLYDKSVSFLSTIPEGDQQFSLVKRSASERFTTTAIGIACD